MRHVPLRPCALVLALGLLPSGSAHAERIVDPYLKGEAGLAIPLRGPQADYFGPGLGARANIGFSVYEWVSFEATLQTAVLPARDAAPSKDVSAPLGLGGGLRLRMPYRYRVSPWVDFDVLYVKTGPLDRLGFSVGVGLHVPLGAQKIVRLGPYLRYFHVDDTAQVMWDSTSGSIFSVGLSVEVGLPRAAASAPGKAPGEAPAAACLPAPAQEPPADRDHDGIPDSADKCPAEAGPVATIGCPDADGDGIVDAEDACPAQAGPSFTQGCPDQDGDGVADKLDHCPTVVGPASASGCPDADGDKVADADDKCPAAAGLVERAGCPAPQVAVTDSKLEINEPVYFDSDKTVIQQRSFGILDEVVRVLQANPKFKVRVEGHTDNAGNARHNLMLSTGRARSVKAYLVGKKVAAARIVPAGFGQKNPIASNATAEGRDKNRRVDFVLVK